MVKRILYSNTGTAEVVGSILILVTLLFFFSNVFLWYNNVANQTNRMMTEKLNSPIGLETTIENETLALKVNALGGRDVKLTRLWIIEVDYNNHIYIDLEEDLENKLWIPAGSYISIILTNETRYEEYTLYIDYQPVDGEIRFKIITSLGNTATTSYTTPTITNVQVLPDTGTIGDLFTIIVYVDDPSLAIKSIVAFIEHPDESYIANVTLTKSEKGLYIGLWNSFGVIDTGTYYIDIIVWDILNFLTEYDNGETFTLT